MWVVVAVGAAQVVSAVVLWAETLCFDLVSVDGLGVSQLSCAVRENSKDLRGDGVDWWMYSRLGGCQSSGNGGQKLHFGVVTRLCFFEGSRSVLSEIGFSRRGCG